MKSSMNFSDFHQMNNSISSPAGYVSNAEVVAKIGLFSAGFFAVICNCFVIGVILRYKSLRDGEDCIYLIGFLAVADGLNALGSTMAGGFRLYMEILNLDRPTRAVCLGVTAVQVFGTISGQIMLACVGLDRVVAIRDPLGYKMKNHLRYAYHSFLITTIYSLISTVAMFGGDLNAVPHVCNASASWTPVYALYFVCFSIVVGVIVVLLYVLMVFVLRQKTRNNLNNSNESMYSELLKREAHVTRVITQIVLIYLALWMLPSSVATATVMLGYWPMVGWFIGPFIAIGVTASCGINVFIYAYKMPKMKSHFKKVLNFKWKGTSVGPAT